MKLSKISNHLAALGLILMLGLVLGGKGRPAAAQSGQYPGFRVEGRHLYDRFGDKVVLVGVNKMVIWTDRDGIPAFSEIAQTGANAARIVWLTEGTARELDIAISNAISHKLIPIIDCHDSTGEWDMLQTCVDYWVRPDVLEVIRRHQEYLLVNIANECGEGIVYEWDFRAAYELAIKRMRHAGIHVPLVIDAQGYGQSIDDLQKNGPYLIEVDPDHNLMFSIHMWWPSAWRGARVEQMVIDEIAESVEMDLPLIIGEFAHKGPGCVCCIPYLTIIEQAHLNEIGYLPWSWGPGNSDCAEMDMTEDGAFATLHGWGEEVALTDPHSIRNVAVRPDWLLAMAPVPTPTAVPTPTPPPAPDGLISLGRPATASSVEGESLPPSNVTDGNLHTRWSSAWQNDQDITLDLGESRDIARIILEWEAAFGREYKLQVSEDGEAWTDLIHVTDSDGGRDEHLVEGRGRYVRMAGIKRATEWGFSLWEFWVFNRADAPLPEPDDAGDVAAPPDLRPDLVVSEIGHVEEYLIKDDGITFTAVIGNQGDATARSGFRCIFQINSETVAWATSPKSLAPGEELTLVAEDGSDGNARWEPTEGGDFVVLAWVDPARSGESGQVDESDEHNNMQTYNDIVRIAAPRPTPTDVPTSAPTETPEATKTPAPGATDAPTTPEPVRPPSRIGLWMGIIVLTIIVGILVTVIITRKRSNRA